MRLIEKILPYLILGVTIALFILALVVLSYVIFWGILIGLIIYCLNWLKQKFFTSQKPQPQQGRIIEHEDIEIEIKTHSTKKNKKDL